MAEISFQVFGHNNKILDVVFKKDGKNMTATCTCSAGLNDICQHRMNILSGSTKEIISKNPEDVKKVISWTSGTDVGKALRNVLECAKHLENATEDFNDARKRLVKAFCD